MNRWKTTTLVAPLLLLAACASTPGTRTGELLLDVRYQQLCLSADVNCRSLDLVIANFDRDRILRAFGLDPWDWSQLDSIEELNSLLLNPPNQAYRPERIDTFTYRLPVIPATRITWDVLDREYRDRYLQEDCDSIMSKC